MTENTLALEALEATLQLSGLELNQIVSFLVGALASFAFSLSATFRL